MLEWFYERSYKTENDYFVLPPSGHLYSYPSQMPTENNVQQNYVIDTERDCQLLSSSGVVTWEWDTHWESAVEQ